MDQTTSNLSARISRNGSSREAIASPPGFSNLRDWLREGSYVATAAPIPESQCSKLKVLCVEVKVEARKG